LIVELKDYLNKTHIDSKSLAQILRQPEMTLTNVLKMKVARGDPEESLQTRLRREGSVQIRRGEQDIDGILNYIICKILLSIYNKKPGYYNYNRMMGVIECVKQELYRRVIGPYEDKKIKENGDII